MGFLSSLFSFGDKPTTKQTVVTPQFPPEMKPYIEQILKDQQVLYQQRMDEGYQPYTGETIAPFTPEEIAAQEGLKSLVGTQAPLQQEALNLARGATGEFTADTAKKYMSPYLRASLDAQKAEAQRQYERNKVPQFEAEAVRAGGMSGLGTRAAVEAAERATGQQRLLADIEAKGQQKAFEAAQQQFENQKARERQAAAQISTAAPQIFKSGMAEQGLLQTVGEDKRKLGQSALDEAYLKYIEQKQFPESQLARYQSAIYGNPILRQPSYTQTGTTTGGGPGLGKTLLGLGATAMGFGLPGGGTVGGALAKKAFPTFFAGGGRINEGLTATMQARPYVNYMRRNMGGKVVPPVVYRQQGTIGELEKTRETIQNLATKKLIKEGKIPTYMRGGAKVIPDKRIPLRPFELPEGKGVVNPYTGKIEKAGPPTQDNKRFFGFKSDDKAVPMSNVVDAKPTEKIKDDSTMPVIIGSAEKYKEKGLDIPDFVGDEDPTAVDKKVASITEKKVMKDILTKAQGNPTAIDLVNNSFKRYKERAEKLLNTNPLEKQKFWATIGAAIMRPGNAFANMAQGIKEAIDGLDADGKTKRKLKLSLLGKEFEKDLSIAKTKASATTSRLNRAKDLQIAAMQATGKARTTLLKQANEELKAIFKNTQSFLKGKESSDIKDMLVEHVKSLKGDSAAKKSLLDKIDDIDEDALYTRIISLPNRKHNTLEKVFDAMLSKLQK